ncbi:alanine dehydrogenase [Photobacterium lipolyticum]|uniref:Alanine dehydrogenase n=1 Tax=Photobacterium lipolyticum TaxID=266810 RepID=A0A2T3N3A8_9GAMM|nr:alanine dehydrogenase [Photobacterium lipolyticum]PSW06755.1 alanine dehydrogenase [Photobacterium lipolyticum]
MDIGVIKEIKNRENRVALTPNGAKALVAAGHTVKVEAGAGDGSGFTNEDYRTAGGQIVTVDAAWDTGLVLKIKEPQTSEFPYLKRQILFTYFHLAGVDPALTEALLEGGTTAIAYETVENDRGKLPLLAPMSAVAGNMAVTVGSYYLAKFAGGKGMQLGSVMGKRNGKVVVLGDGVVGRHAAKVADGMGTNVVIFTRHTDRGSELKHDTSGNLRVALSSPEVIAKELLDADLLIGAALRPGSRAPHLVSKAMVATMQPGSVIVDVSIDQGGCIETSRPTSHSDPVFQEQGVTHYCVTNMPGAYPRTSTIALTSATFDYVLRLASGGISALREDNGFGKGVNTYHGHITCRPVAESLQMLSRFRAFSEITD